MRNKTSQFSIIETLFFYFSDLLVYLPLLPCTVIPPSLSQPYLINKGSTWVQMGWSALDCDGGYQINAYYVEQKTSSYFSTSYTTVARVSNLNYTFHNLIPNTEYNFRVQGLSAISQYSSYSSHISVMTYPAGKEVQVTQFVCPIHRPISQPWRPTMAIFITNMALTYCT